MPRKLYRNDIRRKTAALVNYAEGIGDVFLRSLFLIALAHIDETTRPYRRGRRVREDTEAGPAKLPMDGE